MVCRELCWGAGEHTKHLSGNLEGEDVHVSLFTGKYDLMTAMHGSFASLKYDIIHVQGSPYSPRNTNVPKIVTVHTLIKTERKYEDSLTFRIGEYLERRTLKTADKIIVVNPILKTELIGAYNIPASKICVIYNGINTKEFDVIHVSRAEFILTGGREAVRKHFIDVFEAACKVKLRVSRFGEVFRPREHVINLYKTAKMFVCASVYETGPITVMEAMAAKCPVICSDIPAVKDLVIDGETGILFKPGDVSELAEKMKLLSNTPELCEQLAEDAYKHIKNNFNWEDIAKQTKDVYMEVLK